MSNNLFADKVLIVLDETDSTNEYAKRMLSKNKPAEGTVIFARHQTCGKGQFGKRWESEAGKNLTLSIVFYPDFLYPKQAPALNQAISLGLKDFLSSLGISITIKWPNDIYYHDKKLAGILVENGLIGEKLSYSIAGIGLNVNQTTFNPEIPNPISLKMIDKKDFVPESLINQILTCIERRYQKLKSKRFEEIKEEYSNGLYRLNETRRFKLPLTNEAFEGVIKGVDNEGQLVMEMGGTMNYFNNNELIYL